MTISNSLSDYVSMENVRTINHTLFHEWTEEEFGHEVQALANAITMTLTACVMNHVEKLPIKSGPGESIVVNTIPPNFAEFVAKIIDEQCPDWNIAQKTAIYLQYMITLQEVGKNAYMERVTQARHTRPQPAIGDAKAVPGSEDPGEFDIKVPKHPNLN